MGVGHACDRGERRSGAMAALVGFGLGMLLSSSMHPFFPLEE